MDTMGKLETKWETGRDQGSWMDPCLLHMTVGHHSLVSSQSLHLCPLASEIKGVLKWPRLGAACPSTTPALRYPPDPSMTKPATMGSKDCHHSNYASYFFILVSPSGCCSHCVALTVSLVTWSVWKRTADLQIYWCGRKSFCWRWGKSLKPVVWRIKFGNCPWRGIRTNVSNTNTVPGTGINSLHIISFKHPSKLLKSVLLVSFYR